METNRTIASLVRRLRANATTRTEGWRERNRALWREAEEAGVERAVVRVIAGVAS